MPYSQGEVIAGTTNPWVPAIRRSAALKRDALNVELVATFTGDPHVLSESDWVYLQVSMYAEQIHPWTVDQIDALGPIEGENAARWTWEGPTYTLPGEPANCTFALEVAHSLTSDPGTDYRAFQSGLFKLRSYRVRLVITRPSLEFDFRVYRLATRATRRALPQREVHVERWFSHA